MSPDDVIRRLELDVLYADYAHCLDNDALEDWPEFFTDDCGYRITSAENFEAGLPIGIVYATSKAMLVDRVMALRKANIYEPQRYRHLIGAVKIGVEENGVLPVVANLIVVRIMQDGAMLLFAAGRYRTSTGWWASGGRLEIRQEGRGSRQPPDRYVAGDSALRHRQRWCECAGHWRFRMPKTSCLLRALRGRSPPWGCSPRRRRRRRRRSSSPPSSTPRARCSVS